MGGHGHRRPPARRRAAAVTWSALVAVAALAYVTGEPAATVVVDFAAPVATVPQGAVGFTATTFAVEGGPVVDAPADLALLGSLGAGGVRIHLRAGADGRLVTGAAGGDRAVDAGRWLDAYRAMGLRPTVVLDLDRAEALAVLAGLRASGQDVRRFVLGNEMDRNSRADVPEEDYVRRFREIATALRAVDPGLEIGGPASADFRGVSDTLLRGLLDGPAAGRASFIDVHAYGAGEGERATAESARRYAVELDRLRARIADPSVTLQVGEFNLNWADEPQNGTQAQTVWVATALATILSRGAVAFQYGDRSSAMGLVARGVPQPSYWGIAMVTGAGMFRPLGARMVQVTGAPPDIAAFASTDAKNVLLANPGAAVVTVDLRLRAFAGGEAEVWQTTAGRPVRLGAGPARDRLPLTLAPRSVTTVVLVERGSASSNVTARPSPS